MPSCVPDNSIILDTGFGLFAGRMVKTVLVSSANEDSLVSMNAALAMGTDNVLRAPGSSFPTVIGTIKLMIVLRFTICAVLCYLS